MSEEIVLRSLTIAGPLLGALVGGLIASFSAWTLDRQRWRRDRQEKLAALGRDALAAALEWIEPMRNAETRASSLVMATIRGDVDDEHFLKEFPYLLGDLVKSDLSASQRAVLPNGVYARGHRIVREVDELRILGLKYGQEARVMGKPMAGFQECSAKLKAIERQVSELETELRQAFRETFD